MLISFTNLSLVDFLVIYLVWLCLSSVIDGFEWIWMGSLRKNIQLMLVSFKITFLVQHSSYYTPMSFLMMSSVIMLFMIMIKLSSLSMSRHLVCGSNKLSSEPLTIVRKDLLISVLEKQNLFRLTGLIALARLMWKWMSMLLRRNHLLRWWCLHCKNCLQ